MELYHWIEIGFGVVGLLGTWIVGAFSLGRATESIRSQIKKESRDEQAVILHKMETVEHRFETDQKAQDHNFGEVGAAMRQYIADVEKKLREVEIYGRDNYVKITDFEKALDRVSSEIKSLSSDIKKDLRDLKSELIARP
jgi:hypothetical protein